MNLPFELIKKIVKDELNARYVCKRLYSLPLKKSFKIIDIRSFGYIPPYVQSLDLSGSVGMTNEYLMRLKDSNVNNLNLQDCGSITNEDFKHLHQVEGTHLFNCRQIINECVNYLPSKTKI